VQNRPSSAVGPNRKKRYYYNDQGEEIVNVQKWIDKIDDLKK